MADKDRIAWVDCAKGIAILLVIVGHSVNMPLIRGAIFSFHMPLFFILSGYTTACAQNTKLLVRRLKKTFFSLFVWAYVLFFLRTALNGLTGRTIYTLRQNLAACFWASGVDFIHSGFKVPSFGAPWFLVALFWVRNLYDALHFLTKGRYMTVLSVLITACGALIGQWMYLPFGFDLAMIGFVFYDFGQRLKNCRLQPTASRCVGASFIWGGCLLTEYVCARAYFEVAFRRFPLGPVSFICAMAGSLLCFYICIMLCRVDSKIIHWLCFLGQNSILVYSLHVLDESWVGQMWALCNGETVWLLCLLLLRVIVDTSLACLLAAAFTRLRARRLANKHKNAMS